jgi:hypothetical protein
MRSLGILPLSIASCASGFPSARDLALAVGHVLDHGFDLGEVFSATARSHLGSIGGTGCVSNDSHRRGCE